MHSVKSKTAKTTIHGSAHNSSSRTDSSNPLTHTPAAWRGAPPAPAARRACQQRDAHARRPATVEADGAGCSASGCAPGAHSSHAHARPNPAAGPPNPGWPAHGHELWPAHASGRSERRRAGCASGRRTCAAGGERGARLVGGPRGGALGGRSAGRGSAGNASAPASVDYPAREEASTHEGRGGGGASQGAAHLELLSSKLAFPRRAARSTRVVVTRRARLREDRAQGWHGERG